MIDVLSPSHSLSPSINFSMSMNSQPNPRESPGIVVGCPYDNLGADLRLHRGRTNLRTRRPSCRCNFSPTSISVVVAGFQAARKYCGRLGDFDHGGVRSVWLRALLETLH